MVNYLVKHFHRRCLVMNMPSAKQFLKIEIKAENQEFFDHFEDWDELCIFLEPIQGVR